MVSKSPSSAKIVLNHNEYDGLPQWLSSKESACNAGAVRDRWVENRSLGWEDPLEEVMATYSSILASRIPWTKETRGLQSIGWQRVRYNWSSLACKHAVRYHNDKWFDPKHNPSKGKKKIVRIESIFNQLNPKKYLKKCNIKGDFWNTKLSMEKKTTETT